ncbi:MAG: hypothetical protein WBW48_10190 [Anaerolineae bacterium]
MVTTKVANGVLELPAEVQNWVRPDEELMLFIEGDSLILKKVRPPRLSELAGRAPGDVEIPLQDIVDEVHRHRREKRHASGA